MYEIPNFSLYLLTAEGTVLRKSNKTAVTKQPRGSGSFKLKNDLGVWKEVSCTKLQALVYSSSIPPGFSNIEKYPSLFINKDGVVWSEPSKNNPLGTFYTESCRKGDYPRISTSRYGKLYIHTLLALVFLDKDYLDKGLCVLHVDDNKHNYRLDNLKVGSYSENNKAAYDTGANPSKKQ